VDYPYISIEDFSPPIVLQTFIGSMIRAAAAQYAPRHVANLPFKIQIITRCLQQ
jgi:hypothetical protein